MQEKLGRTDRTRTAAGSLPSVSLVATLLSLGAFTVGSLAPVTGVAPLSAQNATERPPEAHTPLLLAQEPETGAAEGASEGASEGERLFVMKGCLGCHGASGRGGVGPELIRTGLSFEEFVSRLRNPPRIMPAFPPEAVSEEEARAIYSYLGRVPEPPERIRVDLPEGTLDSTACSDCHRDLHPTVVRQFE
ncbi:MAG: c-type cytochrome, partial [Gemmatimonadota bacterium]